jgi:hypothetical protein
MEGNIMAAIDNITPDYLTDEEHIEDAIKVVSVAFRGLRKKQGTVMVAAAYTTYAAVEAGIKQARLAEQWGSVDPITKNVKPLAASYLTNLKRLGKAGTILGIKPGDAQWTDLAGRGGAQIKEVGKVIDGANVRFDEDGKAVTEPLTMDLLDEVLAVAFKDGVKQKSAQITREWAIRNGETVAPEEPSEDDSAPETVEGTRTNKAQFKAGVKALTVLVAELTTEEFTEVEPLVAEFLAAAKKARDFRDKAIVSEEKATA